MSQDDLFQVQRPEVGRPTDRRVDSEFLAGRPELRGLRPFDPTRDVDLTDEINRVAANLRAEIASKAVSTPAWAISSTTDNPRAPEQEELDANEVLHGSRLTASGAVQPLTWEPHTRMGQWVERGEPTATVADVQATQEVAAEAKTAADNAKQVADTAQGTAQAAQVSLTDLMSGTLAVPVAARRLLAGGGIYDILPNAEAGSVDGLTVFQLANGLRAKKNLDATGVITTEGIPRDGVTDCGPQLQALMDYAARNKLKLLLLPGTYLTKQELVFQGQGVIEAAGNGWQAGGAVPMVTIKAGAPMRSVMRAAAEFASATGVTFDAAKKANYAVFEQGHVYSTWDNCGYVNAVLDGLHRAGGTNNDGNQYYQCIWKGNGWIYGTADVLAHPSLMTQGWLKDLKKAAPGTVSTIAGGTVVSGSGTTFTQYGIRAGDMLRIGADNSQWGEIKSVDSDTQITLAHTVATSVSGSGYSIHVGDGLCEEWSLDNNIAVFFGGITRGNAGSGMVWAGVYGDTCLNLQTDYNGAWGLQIGRWGQSVDSPTWHPSVYSPYIEFNGIGDLAVGCAKHAAIYNPINGTNGTPGYNPRFITDNKTPNMVSGWAYGVEGQAVRLLGGVIQSTNTGMVLPRAPSVPSNGDLSSAAFYANRFPVGLTITPLNGFDTNLTGLPPGVTMKAGVLQTVIDPAYMADGGGFGYQMFIPALGAGGAWIRFGFDIAENQPWGAWRRLDTSPQPAPPLVTAAPTADDFNGLVALLIDAGSLRR